MVIALKQKDNTKRFFEDISEQFIVANKMIGFIFNFGIIQPYKYFEEVIKNTKEVARIRHLAQHPVYLRIIKQSK